MIRLLPTLALVWRTPTTLQIGATTPVVTMHAITPDEERLIGFAQLGMPYETLVAAAELHDIDHASVDAFLRAIAPALDRDRKLPQRTIALDVGGSSGVVAGWLRHELSSLGEVTVTRQAYGPDGKRLPRSGKSRAKAAPDIAVVVDHMVRVPARASAWLRREVNTLPIVLGDNGVEVGPYVRPGVSACAECVNLHRSDELPEWRAMASQLLHQPSPLDTEDIGMDVARRVRRWLEASDEPFVDAMLSYEPRTGRWSRRDYPPHPECGCRFPQGIETALARCDASDQ